MSDHPKMGPKQGTPEYDEQVERIGKLLNSAAPRNDEEVGPLLLMYILDITYARGAIAEAESKYRKTVLKIP